MCRVWMLPLLLGIATRGRVVRRSRGGDDFLGRRFRKSNDILNLSVHL